MAKEITPSDRRRLADKAGINEQYLYQCLTGRRDMGAVEARRCVDEHWAGEIAIWDVCQKTWHLIWPDLIGTEGAPAVPVAEGQGA